MSPELEEEARSIADPAQLDQFDFRAEVATHR